MSPPTCRSPRVRIVSSTFKSVMKILRSHEPSAAAIIYSTSVFVCLRHKIIHRPNTPFQCTTISKRKPLGLQGNSFHSVNLINTSYSYWCHRVVAADCDHQQTEGDPLLITIDGDVQPQNFGVHTAWREARDRDT